jgi:16S rRNA (cytidine1402-2'-O)-methyltransferase
VSTLYVVATPIGNLEDVTLRALRVLADAALVLAEDTRRTRVLLDQHAIKARPLSLHAHNEAARIARVRETLDAGGDVALVSDAGTPLVSDPGARLVAAVVAAGHPVSALPGASALLAALVVSGLPTERVSFMGFAPRRKGERAQLFAELRARRDTLVFFEAPHRLAATLAALAEALGPRRACVARELTKLHEEVVRDTLPALAERFADGARGEVTLVVAGAAPAPAVAPADLDAEIRARLAAGETPRDIAAALARASDLPKREIYARVLALRDAE